jgi:2-keto-4-pentenoate hydratase/2-oxohepta-3-ene-1,7-dioic acid hydratase in catechol pathway
MSEKYTITRQSSGVAVDTSDGSPLLIRQILGIGRNYAEHANEQGAAVPDRPMVFSKNVNAVSLPGDPIVIPDACKDREQVDYEGELAVVIGAPARDVRLDLALEPIARGGVVLGYCIANDVSARWWQKQGAGGQFFRGKSFDTFCPIGPWVTPAELVSDPQSLRITTRLNDEIVQDAPTSQMIFPVAELIAELSRGTTLVPGTLILTGTPAGVGMARDPQRFLRPSDEVRITIGSEAAPDLLGELNNRVAAD